MSDILTVSVVMRTWNRPDLLKRAVASIRAQTFQNWQLIIVDDASTNPEVPPLLDELSKDEKIVVIRNEKNRDGHCIILNQGVERADGKYVAFCDDDDARNPDWLAMMVGHLESHPEHMYVICQSIDTNENGSTTIHRGVLPANIGQICSRNFIDLGELFLRREVFDSVGLFNEDIHYGDDWEFVSRLIRCNIPAGIVLQPLCIHHLHKGGQLHTRIEAQRVETQKIIADRKIKLPVMIAVFWPGRDRLQESQLQVVQGTLAALRSLPYVRVEAGGEAHLASGLNKENCNFIFVACPFQCEDADLKILRGHGIPMIALLAEDPPAINRNLQLSVFFDWVITNDMSTIKCYQDKARKEKLHYKPENVGFMPSLSINSTVLTPPEEYNAVPKEYDMIICGYMYDSRREWFKKVCDKIDWKLLLVGRRWEEFSNKFEVLGDQSPANTMELYAKSRVVACVHRITSDLGGGSIPFHTAARGYIEAYSGSLVLIDNTREIIPPFEEDEVLVYDYPNPDDFIQKAHWALNEENKDKILYMGKKAQRRAANRFTFVARLKTLLRELLTPRVNIRIR